MKILKSNKMSGWKASDQRRFPFLNLNITNKTGFGSKKNTNLGQKHFIQLMHQMHEIPLKRNQLKNNFQAAVCKIDKQGRVYPVKLIYSRFSIFHHSDADSILILNNSYCPMTLIKQLNKENYPFVIFSGAHKHFMSEVEMRPSDWQQGLINHVLLKLKLDHENERNLELFKIYLAPWQRTVELISNIENLSVATIKNISTLLPESFLS